MAATGAEIASAYVTITTKFPGVQSQVNKALGGVDVNRGAGSLGSRMGSALAGAVGGAVAVATSKAIGMITSSIAGAVKRVDTMNNFPKIMKNLGYSASDAQKSIKKMSDGLAGLPTSLDAMAGTVQQLAPLTGGLEEATTLSLALNNAMLAGGKSTDIQANAMEQYTQMLAIGKVDMAAWRSMVSAMPGQMDQLSVSLLGAGNKSMDLYEALKSGEVTFDQFNDAIVKLNTEGVDGFASFSRQAKDATDGISTGWSNLNTAVTRNLANIIQKLKPAIDAFLTGATQIVNAVGPIALTVIDVAVSVGGWADANKDWLVPALIMVGTLTAVYKGVKLVQAVTLGYQAAMKGAQIATFLSGGALKAYNVMLPVATLRTKLVSAATAKWTTFTKAHAAATTASGKAQAVFNLILGANPVMKIVTAIAALVAGLTWFFTKTETGQKIWAEFTGFLSEAWANVSSFFKTVWESYLKPVFDGIGIVVQWLWKNILEPYFNGWKFLFAIVGGIIAGIWESVLKPVFDGIGAVVGWLWNNIVKPYFGLVAAQFRAVGAVVSWLWTNAVQPAFNFIGQAISLVWNSVIKPVFAAMHGVIANTLGPVFTWLKANVIDPVWNGIKATISAVWTNGIKPVIDTLVRVIQSDPKKAFEAARDAIGVAWSGIQELAKKPVKFVIETVINGLIGTINKIPGVDIPKVPLPKGFAQGGILPGWSRMSHGDDQLIAARRGEGVMVSEALRTPADKALFTAANNAGRRGIGLAQSLAGLQGLAKGGFVHPLPGAVITEEYGGYPGHKGIDMALPAGSPISAAASGLVNFSGWYGGGGWMAGIDHRNGFVTHYKHMMSPPPVKVGQPVAQGQVIGFEGSTGDSTGPHLHFETILNGNRLNPRNFMKFDGSDSGDGGFFNLLSGLKEGLLGKLKDAFPGGDMFVDVAAGLASSAIDGSLDFVKSMLGFHKDNEPTLYDNGGWLQPGLSLVANKTGTPERILTDSQWDAVANSGSGGLQPGDRLSLVVDGEEFEAYVSRNADARISSADARNKRRATTRLGVN